MAQRIERCFGGVALLLLLLGSAVCAESPSSIKITARNQSQFSLLDKRKPALACHRGAQIGALSRAQLVPGVRWSRQSEERLSAIITALEGKLRRVRSVRLAKELRDAKLLRGRVQRVRERCQTSTPEPLNDFQGDPRSLEPYREQLSEREVQYLLDKVAFGGDARLRVTGLERGLSALIDELIDGVLTDSERSAFETKADRWADFASWYESNDLPGKRVWTAEAVQAAQIYRMIYSPEPLREWMSQMLAAHFAVNLNRIGFSYNTYSHRGLPQHVQTIRAHALGSFEVLSKSMLTDPAMNEWLDNYHNSVEEPNQNFARELLELFILGEVDPTTKMLNYTESSIVAATAAVSGYVEVSERDTENGNEILSVAYDNAQHDTRRYTFFSGIPGADVRMSFTPAGFIEHVLYQHPGSPRYVAERFGGQFLYPGLPDQLIQELANILRQERYQMKPFLKRILRSSAFFSSSARGSCFVSPLEHFVRLARAVYPTGALAVGDEREERFYYGLVNVINAASESGQRLFEPPSVFAWKGACNINRAGEISDGSGWISMQRVLGRLKGCGEIMNLLNWIELDFPQRLDLSERMNPYQLVDQVRRSLGIAVLSAEETDALVRLLVTELDDDGIRWQRRIDLNEEWWVRRKIPRLICLLTELPSRQVR